MNTPPILFVSILLIVLVIIVVLVFVFRDDVFKRGQVLGKQSNEELNDKGYGTYKTVSKSDCITTDGKCNSAGVQYTSEFCVPHPNTGKGCINENGEQTFEARTKQENCQVSCRSYVLQETPNSYPVCNYDYPYNLPAYNCITANAQAFYYATYACTKNDSVGDNACTHKCSQSGVDSAGLKGDVDPSKLSYIPICVNKPGATITLNTFSWQNINNLGAAGFTTSKGYLIKNTFGIDNKVNPNLFTITPSYPPWSENPSNTITLYELKILDSEITVYKNCAIDKQYEKPLCNNFYSFPPLGSVESDYTNNPNPTICTMDSGFTAIKECYYNPWYSPLGIYNNSGGTGLNFVNPYVGTTGQSLGATGAYSWYGIGNFGYISTALSCLTSTNPLTGATGYLGNTGYEIPRTQDTCLNLYAPPSQCSSSYTNIFSTTPLNNLSQIIRDFDAGIDYRGVSGSNYPLTSYPQTPGTTNYSCITEFPDGNKIIDGGGNNIPGCVQTCMYRPSFNDINFNYPGPSGQYLHSAFQDILGRYILIQYEDTINNNYFLTVQNTPCGVSGTAVPLTNCQGTAPYSSTPTVFVYDGGGGLTGGQYWSKNGCDSESIILTTAARLTISPQDTFVSQIDGTYNLVCDIYVNVAGYYGYLTPSGTGEIGWENLQNFNTNNIIANGTGNNSLTFNSVPRGTQISRSSNSGKPYFIINYNPSTFTYTLYANTFASDIVVSQILNGKTSTTNTQVLSFTTEANKSTGSGYFTTEAFDQVIIKTGGVFEGKNVSRSINIQRQNSCYNYGICQTNKPANETCYNTTCNLFYEYNSEYCG